MNARRPKGERAGGRLVFLVIASLAVLAAGGYGAAYLVAGEKVPRGTSVAGVVVGGRTEADAARALERGLGDRARRPIEVTAGSVTKSLRPADLGLGIDYAASVLDAGGGRSWRPRRLWDYYTGGRKLSTVVEVDDRVMRRTLRALGKEAGTPAKDGAVAFVDGRVEVTAAQVGSEIDIDAAAEMLRAAYLAEDPDDAAVEVPLRTTEPDIDQADVEEAVTTFANPAVSAPVTLIFGSAPVRLQPRDFAAALAMRPEGGELVPDLDTDTLNALVASATGGAGAPVDASVALVDGKPEVTKSKPGVTYAPDAITASFLDTLSSTDQRELSVEASVAEPTFTTRDARALKIKQKVSSFTTYYPYADYRNINIGRAAELINGTVLKPGDTFSLNDTVGERTRENGFTDGFVINNGILVEDLGGGVSQMATTTFNAMFFAGLEDVEHRPHSFYIDRYPVGREATVAWGAIDLRFKNDTPYGVLVEARVIPGNASRQGTVAVSMWSTKVWDITTATGERYRPTAPKTRTLDTDDCYPNSGYAGFDIDVVRYFRKVGESVLDHEEKFHTTYNPSDTVICKPR